MKRMIPLLCALAMLLVGCVPVLAASEDRPYYPVAVEESFEGGVDDYRIRKVYQLSLSDDPANIPVQDFERNGYTFHLLDMTRKDDVGIDTMPWIETVTKASDTNDLEKILQMLDAEIEVTTEDGYAGSLRLDHTTVQVSVDGYATKTRPLSATRTYPNLSDADVSLVPKTITDGGNTLELDDVQWTESLQTEAEGVAVRYSATASYTGSASSRYATGYTVTANYSGEVARTGCDVVTYTAIFGVLGVPETTVAEPEPTPTAAETSDRQETAKEETPVKKVNPLAIGAVALALAGGGFVAFKKFRRR